MKRLIVLFTTVALGACGSDAGQGAPEAPAQSALTGDASKVLSTWVAGNAAYGVFVPSDGPPRDEEGNRLPAVYSADMAQSLGENPLIEYLFLNLEPAWDAAAIEAMVEGLARVPATDRPVLLVRTPVPDEIGLEATGAQIAEALAKGADGVVIPHIQTPEQASTVVGFFESAGADVWSPQNPDGKILAMIMIEDPSAVEVAAAIADTPGYSVLACGIGSLTGAIGGDRNAGEAGCMAVLAEGNRVGVYSMMTAMTPESVIDRIERGYLGILSFPSDEYEAMVQAGRDAQGR